MCQALCERLGILGLFSCGVLEAGAFYPFPLRPVFVDMCTMLSILGFVLVWHRLTGGCVYHHVALLLCTCGMSSWGLEAGTCEWFSVRTCALMNLGMCCCAVHPQVVGGRCLLSLLTQSRRKGLHTTGSVPVASHTPGSWERIQTEVRPHTHTHTHKHK